MAGMMKNFVEKKGGWGAAKLEPWREAERSLKAMHDPTMVVTLPRLRFMENDECSEQENPLSPLLSPT